MGLARVVKRFFDIVGAAALLILFSPLLALVIIVVRRDSPGPAIFRQTRIGLHGAPFQLFKIRTMRLGAESAWAAPDPHNFSRYVFQVPHDARITKLGGFLRATSIDELPQLVNVLKGEMSLVGPRPEIPGMVALYTPEMHRRHDMRPGMTGLAQISGRGALTTGEILSYDLQYCQSWTLKLDFWILWRTMCQIFRGQ